jgi:hypothetical protein
MAKITRETLLKNLQVHDDEKVGKRNEGIWDRVMQKFDAATKRGERSICVGFSGTDFSTYEIDYIKERAVKEGMRWHWGALQDSITDPTPHIVLEL